MISKICQYCGNKYHSPSPKFCSLSCSSSARGKLSSEAAKARKDAYELSPKLCEYCGIGGIPYSQRSIQKYCSSSCAATVNNKKTPKRIKKPKTPYPRSMRKQHRYDCVCQICSENFIATSPDTKTCSPKCKGTLIGSKSRANPKCGGSTKQYIAYKGVSLDSSWELSVAMSLDENSIRWERPTFFRLLDGRRYTPDFYLPDFKIYLDPKAYRKGFMAQVEKIKIFETEYTTRCLVLTKNQLSWGKIQPLISKGGDHDRII